MRVGVVGAGIVGIATAHELTVAGHEVTVFERRGTVAEGASFANAGVVAPGYVTPWSSPGMAWKVLGQLFSPHAAVRVDPRALVTHLPWLWRWWRACRPDTYAANRTAMHQLAMLSRDRMLALARGLRLDFEQRAGYLVLLRSERDLRAAQTSLSLLREWGLAHHLVTPEQARRIEPALGSPTALHAAIHLPQDLVGNCRQFAHLLKAEAQRLGAAFRFETQVAQIEPGTRPVLRSSDGARHELDGVVVCAGVDSASLLSPIGCRLPLAPVYGYSVTAPLRMLDGRPDDGPRGAVMDERYKVAISRLGTRVRVAGSAEFGGPPERLRPAALRTLYKVLDDWFPGAAVVREAQQWKGARPMLADGPPLLGASGAPGVWLNLGHGSSGWALACGSAQVLAEQLSGRAPPLDMTRLSLGRLRRGT